MVLMRLFKAGVWAAIAISLCRCASFRSHHDYLQAISLFQRQDYIEAYDWTERSLMANPGNVQVALLQAWVHFYLGEYEPARRSFEEILVAPGLREPWRVEAAKGEVYADYRLTDYSEAVESIEHNGLLQLNDPDIWIVYGWSRWFLGDLNGAEAGFLGALDFRYGDADARHGMAAVEFSRGRYESSLEHAESSIRCNPTVAGVWLLKGDCLFRMGLYEKAEESFEKALALEPGNMEAIRAISNIR